MGITLNLRQAKPRDVHVGQSPLAELMAVLHILAEPDHHPEARQFVQELTARLDPALRDELSELSPLWARLRCRLMFPLTTRLDQDFAAELRSLAALPLEEFVDLCATGVLGFGQPLPPAAELSAGGPATRAYVAQCERRSFTRGALAHALVTSPEEFRGRLLAFLTACQETFFGDVWQNVQARTAPTVARLRDRLKHGRVADLLVELSPTASASADGSRVRYDKLMIADVTVGPHPLLLIPSVNGWPHLTVKDDDRYPAVVHFAVQGSRAPREISLRQLSERLTALASPSRMELCRHLLGEPITTSELAQRLGTAESQVSRAIRQLRDAGLVESARDGKYVHHRLATNALLRLGQDVLTAVMR